ncbi:MAG: 6-bladed beta-propeller [Phycisphaerales bacterium]|nr:MAG: 6-bladed beta-propeller [Phycisphaerales bacterium]
MIRTARRFGGRHCWVWPWVLAAGLAISGAGCAPQSPDRIGTAQAQPVWPEPPEQARIMYLGQVLTEKDLQKGKSWLQGLGELVFGKGAVGVLVCPYAVAVDGTGVMFVADSAGAAVHMFNLSNRDYRQFSQLADGQMLQKPVGLALYADRLYVTDSGLRQICVFHKDGTFLFAFGSERLQRPSGIACGPGGSVVYVADTAAHTVYAYDLNGRFLRQLGGRGLNPGQFNFPTHLCVDAAGQLYISDTLNYRIQVFTPEGMFLRMFGQQGDRPGNFAHPCAVATDRHGNIYVTDRQFENVQIFDSEGRILMAFGHEGKGPGEFWLPGGIFIDARSRIYVADSFNKRIQIFALLEDTQR